MKTQYQGQEVRNSTESQFAIFYLGKELTTTKTGGINSMGGIVLESILPTGESIRWRSNDVYGRKGFAYNRVIISANQDDKNRLPSDLREKLEYKIF